MFRLVAAVQEKIVSLVRSSDRKFRTSLERIRCEELWKKKKHECVSLGGGNKMN